MIGSTPLIYASRADAERLSLPYRLLSAGVAAGCAAVLIIAAGLKPDPSGVATHTRLGLQKCWMLDHIGIPCATCGMTTSFSHFAHGNLLASFYVQPMGAVLATLASIAFWIALYLALTGRPALRLMHLFPMRHLTVGMLFFALLAWGWKIMIHLSGMDGW
ncbi:MAG TPA: DUF2752 domain-containing protein [Tepidisphaeraceae bacterium]|nr:DUF2752 domain-containing protein [Tepidisphaeraceae bacterium]